VLHNARKMILNTSSLRIPGNQNKLQSKIFRDEKQKITKSRQSCYRPWKL